MATQTKNWPEARNRTDEAFGFFKATENNNRWVEVVTQGGTRTKTRTHLFSLQRIDTLTDDGTVSSRQLQLIFFSYRFILHLKLS